VFNLTAVAETPRFSNNTARLLASGWRVAPIYRRSSGTPMTVISGTDRALSGINNQRPNQVLANPYGDKSGKPNTNWLNPAAFALPPLGELGNVARNSVVTPPTWSFDMALSRVFGLANANKIEARIEIYNVTNAFRPSMGAAQNIGGVNLFTQSLNSNTFGQIRDSLDPRILQFAIKYMF
jgi:hypothetical protein